MAGDLGDQVAQDVVGDVAVVEALTRGGSQFPVNQAAHQALGSQVVIFRVGDQFVVFAFVEIRHARSVAEDLTGGDLLATLIVQLEIGQVLHQRRVQVDFASLG